MNGDSTRHCDPSATSGAASARNESLLSVRGLEIRFSKEPDGSPAVARVDLDVDRGEYVGLIGESGSGKSLTALAIVGLVPAGARVRAERLSLEGKDLRSLDAEAWRRWRGREVGFVFQDPTAALHPLFTIGDQLVETIRTHDPSISRREARDRAVEFLERVRMPDPARRAESHPHELSGGMRQRAMIALAIAPGPSLLIADEPTTALDVTIEEEILDLFDELRRASGIAVLLITHDFDIVAGRADRVVVLRAGRVVETCDARSLRAVDREPYTRALATARSSLASVIAAKIAIATPANKTPASKTPILLARGIVRHYASGARGRRVRAVDGIDLDVVPQETLGLVGESGCGKSTLARCLIGLERVDAGSVRFDGFELTALSERRLRPLRRRLQLIPQHPLASLDPRKTVGAAVVEGLEIHGIGDRRERARRVDEILSRCGLDPSWSRRLPHELSGGERQRVAIARALVLEPDLVICDEPVASLDPPIQGRIIELLRSLGRELGLTYIFISHDLATVAAVSDRIAVDWLGRVVEFGPAATVLGSPVHPYTQRLVRAVTRRELSEHFPNREAPPSRELPFESPSQGCRYAPRCPLAVPRCLEVEPVLETVAGRQVACHASGVESAPPLSSPPPSSPPQGPAEPAPGSG
jgi:peptide/nickel transport system ATP-binding protein